MASSKVMMASNSPANPDLPRQQSSSIHSISAADIQGGDQSKTFGSMNMDEILRNIYSEDADAFPEPAGAAQNGGAGADGGGGGVVPVGNKTVDEVWKEIVAGSGGGGSREPEMTLEDFLTKAGAVTEDDVRIPPVVNGAQFQAPPGGYGVDLVGFGNGIEGTMVAVGAAVGSSGGGVGRGKRRAVEEPQLDRATQQKQRRMIKNRESAARSRERKQAYTVELESLVTQLEEENLRLLKEEAEQSKERFKQLMDNLIPVVEQRRPPRSLRRMHSMCW